MKEEFLHYLWRFQLFAPVNLKTTGQEEIIILSPGLSNPNSGPDFLNAKIKIGDQIWAGDVEIHVQSSDWNNHKHHTDANYKSVILHVVLHDDRPVTHSETKIKTPTLSLDGKFNFELFNTYKYFLENKLWIPCYKQISKVSDLIRSNWFERMAVERLEQKTTAIEDMLNVLKGNWDELFYYKIARSFGFKVNAEAFEILAKSLPLKVLSKHKQNLFQIEALLFGQAGFLDESLNDEYPKKLHKEYLYLKELYKLNAIKKNHWHFLRLRPSNFPTIRIAQFASLIHKSSFLFSKLIETTSMQQICKMLESDCSEYWKWHYVFDKQTKISEKKLGKLSINNLLINTVIPVIYSFGQIKNDELLKERMINFLKDIEAEINSLINNWANIGINAESAFTSQALIHLKNNYCDKKKCLNCAIGVNILGNSI